MTFVTSLFLVIFCSISFSLRAEQVKKEIDVLTIERLLKSSYSHSPEIKSAIENVESARGELQTSLSPFDLSLDNDTYVRLRGFYSGDYNETKLNKRLTDYNTKLSLGYRVSDGTFPIYQDYYRTKENGELSLTVAFSLLRNNDIDKDRFNIFKEQIDLDQATIDALLTKIFVQQKAFKAYLDWVSAGLKYDAFKKLLNEAQKRQNALKVREKKGDIPKIQIVENSQIILQRKEVLQTALNNFENARNNLSIFWRDKNGDTIIPRNELLPKNFPIMKDEALITKPVNIDSMIAERPELKKFDNAISISRKEIELGENNLKPKLDFEFYNAEDFGSGSITRDGFESTATINLSFDLQQNLGRGQIKKARAEINSLKYKKQQLFDNLTASLNNIFNNIDAAKNIVEYSDQEISLAKRMEIAENELFKNGQSNFFLINAREIATANAKVRNIDAKKLYSEAIANYLIATLDLKSIGIVD